MEWGVPNDPQTKFKIGSKTKQFTARLILQYVNEGKISLAGHLSEYLPYYRKDSTMLYRFSSSALSSSFLGIRT